VRVVFLIRSLQPGGAERQLVALARNLNPDKFSTTIVTYYEGEGLANELRGLPSVRVVCAGKRGRWDIVGFFWRLWKIVRVLRPHVIHGYMYGANEVALLLAWSARAKIVWGVRLSGLDMQYYDWTTRLLFKTGAWLSPHVDAIIANSEAGRTYHIGLGYPAPRFVVIPNGIDTEIYKRDQAGRERVRSQWSVNRHIVLIGIVARIDPMKDHETFLRAATALVATNSDVQFVLVGPGSDRHVFALKTMTERLGIGRHIIWAGPRKDMSAVYSAIDIVTSSSAFGEGFSNSLAEAMACEAVCVATDVGDARTVVGDTGGLVPPREPQALAMAWQKVIYERPDQRTERGRRARARIINNFSVAMLAARTEDLLLRVADSTEALAESD
jgi:glycosyltransferase involved in cell wall biosynthesis